MTKIEKAKNDILKKWGELEHEIKDGHEAVWFAKSDLSESYEVDEEWLGLKGDGSFVWAYASGCSCWDGDYDGKVEKEIKAFKLEHNRTYEEWENSLTEFVDNGFKIVNLDNC